MPMNSEDIITRHLLEWAIALHGRVLVPFLQMNSTYHNSTFIIYYYTLNE